MRLDKFLKVTRIIKRRTVAKELDIPPESLKKEFIDEYIQIID